MNPCERADRVREFMEEWPETAERLIPPGSVILTPEDQKTWIPTGMLTVLGPATVTVIEGQELHARIVDSITFGETSSTITEPSGV